MPHRGRTGGKHAPARSRVRSPVPQLPRSLDVVSGWLRILLWSFGLPVVAVGTFFDYMWTRPEVCPGDCDLDVFIGAFWAAIAVGIYVAVVVVTEMALLARRLYRKEQEVLSLRAEP